MRVIAGRLGGRTFGSPPGNRTHPMSEKARGAIFNALGDITGLTVLDAYAGSGALGIEALSRGAKSVVAVDVDKRAVRTIKEHAETFGLVNIAVYQQSIVGWCAANTAQTFDLVFADPPYDDIQLAHVKVLASHLSESGVFVLSWPGSKAALAFDDLNLVAHKPLGDIQLIFYKK